MDEPVSASESCDDDDELWTTGRAADELAELGIKRRQVSRLIDSGKLVGVQSEAGNWRLVRASSVRRYKARMLAKLADTPEAKEPGASGR